MTAEQKDVLRFGMVIVGLGALLGSLVGAVYGTAREVVALLSEDEEPL